MPALPMAEQVAGLEPAIAANSAQVKTLAMPRPPGMRCIHACIAEYKSLPALDLPIAAPFRMKSGMDSNVMLDISSYTFWVTVSSDDAGMKKYMKPTATVPSEKAIGMPENMTIRVTAPNSRPSASMLMAAAPWTRSARSPAAG